MRKRLDSVDMYTRYVNDIFANVALQWTYQNRCVCVCSYTIMMTDLRNYSLHDYNNFPYANANANVRWLH